jgi:hypothetical protein
VRKRACPHVYVAIAALGGTLGATRAHAGSFFADGTFTFDAGSVAAFSFEDGAPPSPDPMAPPLVLVESDTALEGRWLVTLAPYQSVDLPLTLPPGAQAFRASVWIRGGDAVGYLVVSHEDEGPGASEVATLFPTGRITSDGWVELANDNLAADGLRSVAAIGVFSPTGAEVDAAEVVAQGPASVSLGRACAGVADGASCGAGQVCYWSECRNVNGWVPPIPADRDDVQRYFENRLRFLFGPYLNRSLDLPAVASALEGMRAATDPWAYWNGFMLAVRRLHDGHTSTSGLADFVLQNPRPINVCFIEGEADLSQGVAPSDPIYGDVLVSHAGALRNLGLAAGDRLVRVDGQHPLAWARTLEGPSWSHSAVSNHRTFAEHASDLRRFIARFAHEIEVVRCDSAAQTCGAVETISIADIPPLVEGEEVDFVACDNRPLRHVPDAPASHSGDSAAVYAGLLDVSDPVENIYGLEWESLYTNDGSDGVGANLQAALDLVDSAAASGVILDHRTGTGGTFGGPAIVWDWALSPRPLTFFEDRQFAEAEQPSLLEGAAIWQAALADQRVLYIGSGSPTTIPIALLITQDVSASDWLPLGLKGAPNVRIFGPFETNGGFSTRYQLSYTLGMSFVLASGDSFLESGMTHNGTGVAPDVVVAPRQSDLLVGVDTVFQAAVDWVRQEIEP